MLRLLILCLVLTARVTSQEGENEASGDNDDDEPEMLDVQIVASNNVELGLESPDTGIEDEDGFPTIIVATAVCLVALVAVTTAAAILIRRRMQNRQQGVYSVPVEQSEKTAI